MRCRRNPRPPLRPRVLTPTPPTTKRITEPTIIHPAAAAAAVTATHTHTHIHTTTAKDNPLPGRKSTPPPPPTTTTPHHPSVRPTMPFVVCVASRPSTPPTKGNSTGLNMREDPRKKKKPNRKVKKKKKKSPANFCCGYFVH